MFNTVTHHLVFVIDLQHHRGRLVLQSLGVSVDLHTVKDQSLVPRWVQRGLHRFSGFAHVQEGHVSVGICLEEAEEYLYFRSEK